ncbi:MAG TPA: dihydrolipoyl dehydrogenase [Dehalococcoidia bacterium]|nr:dihydrolipoyl dehydrogenase [Dehalococcoidia bacterium]
MPRYDVAIIGGGPGGYVAAIRAAQLGLSVALVERDRVGGLCLNWGCIPSKALLYSAELFHLLRRSQEFGIACDNLRFDLGQAVDRSRQVVDRLVRGVELLLSKNGVIVLKGTGRLQGRHEIAVEPGGQTTEADSILLATGGLPRTLPGVGIDGQTVIASREALELRQPPASIAIVGGGPIGVEFAYLYRSCGCEVTIIEMLKHLLPQEDEEISQQIERALKQQGIRILTSGRVEEISHQQGGARVAVTVDGRAEEVRAEKVLIGIGFAANSEGLGLEENGVVLEKGFVRVDDHMRTSVEGVYAIGDLTGKLMLAHVASAQGVAAVEHIAGLETPQLDYEKMPRCTYCQPQVASWGLTEAQARERRGQVKVGRFPFRANGRALAMGSTDGMVKLVVDAEEGDILGYHIIGPEAAELIAEASLGGTLEAAPTDLAWAVHAHPTLSEAMKEAALDADGRAVHFWRG